MSTVFWAELAERDREVERDRRLADPALRGEDAHDAGAAGDLAARRTPCGRCRRGS
jgi:hypothetical protein